jgi:hypothetical protein
MRTHRILLAATVLCALAPLSVPSAAAEPLDLQAGTMQLGGSLAFQTIAVVPDEGDSSTMYMLAFQPTFSAFVVKGLQVGGGLSALAFFGDGADYLSTSVSLFVLVRYVIDTGSIVSPYFGGRFGASFHLPADQSASDGTFTALYVSVPMGILLVFNKRVAINLGLAVDVYAWLDGDYMKDAVQIQVPVGYLGVEAFF